MKICYIFSNFHLVDITGQPALIQRLAQKAKEKGNSVFIVSNSMDEAAGVKDGRNLLILKGLGDLKTFLKNGSSIKRYLKLIQPDIVHVHGYLLTVFIYFLRKPRSCRLVSSVCETLEIVKGIYRKFALYCLKRLALVIVSCEYIRAQLIKEGISGKKILVARLGLKDEFLDGFYLKEEPDTDILYYGDSKKERGFDIILGLARRLPGLSFKVLLRWQYPDSSNELRELNRMPNVKVLFYPYKEALKDQLLKSRLVVLPYRWMGMRPPLSLIESMAAGKCVITSALEGNSEIIRDRHNGIIADFDDLEEVANRITDSINDLGLLKSLADKAHNTIKKLYSADEYTKVLDAWNALLP